MTFQLHKSKNEIRKNKMYKQNIKNKEQIKL